HHDVGRLAGTLRWRGDGGNSASRSATRYAAWHLHGVLCCGKGVGNNARVGISLVDGASEEPRDNLVEHRRHLIIERPRMRRSGRQALHHQLLEALAAERSRAGEHLVKIATERVK